MPSTAVVRWVPPQERPEAIEEQQRKRVALEMRQAEQEARLAVAKAKAAHYGMMQAGRDLVRHELEKLLVRAQSADFADAPVADLKDLIKLAEVTGKDFRLANGLATENIAHALTPSIDFAKMTQAERDEWRRLAIKGGVPEE